MDVYDVVICLLCVEKNAPTRGNNGTIYLRTFGSSNDLVCVHAYYKVRITKLWDGIPNMERKASLMVWKNYFDFS
ncbi:hypothetical protein POVCU2_0092350 [Plasmodium ovale curtisi]|uniref:Uncharacterized protein n=1 Tax=Plasmodium ovale curtisi TaxID=864141 RepID=A0A1A8WC30_PLAOA|nr:hypothetical protein POVCU1_018260 [Plasmodium ovale curtisi]SBS94995.1 hypothetical protein POVCU2_0092350 [Plasmodium ovale curtisi]